VIQPLLSQQGYTYDQKKKSMVTIAERVDIEALRRRVDQVAEKNNSLHCD
jgi:hypothetical protein